MDREFIMNRLLIALVMATACPARAEFRLLDIDRMSIDLSRFGCNREPLTPQYDCKDYVGRIASEFDLRLLEYGYWRNRVHTEGIKAQVKTVGWEYEFGLRVVPELDVFYHHHSRHVMDDPLPVYQDNRQGKFPVSDEYGVRMNFYINPRPNWTLLGGE
jgi:hypothetical protein